MTIPDAPSRVDVLVVGADLAGRWVARGLERAGASVLLTGGDGPPPGLVSTLTTESPARLVASVGRDVARELLGLGGESAALLGLARADAVWVASAPGEEATIRPAVEALEALGIAAVEVDRRGLESRGLTGERGFVVVDGAAWVDVPPGEARLPAPVRVDDVLDGVAARFADGTVVRAEVVVLAGEGAALHPALLEQTAAVWEHEVTLGGQACAGHAGHGGTTFWPAEGGVRVCGARWATPDLGYGRTSVAPAVVEALVGFGRRHLRAAPCLGVRGWVERHGCDGLPLVGPMPGAGRWVACLGFGGSLGSFGPAAAERLVAGLAGGDRWPLPAFAPSRFVG